MVERHSRVRWIHKVPRPEAVSGSSVARQRRCLSSQGAGAGAVGLSSTAWPWSREQRMTNPDATPAASGLVARIAGVSVLKGLLLYGAVLTFAGFYSYFMAKIASAPEANPPALDGTMVSVAAALAGVLDRRSRSSSASPRAKRRSTKDSGPRSRPRRRGRRGPSCCFGGSFPSSREAPTRRACRCPLGSGSTQPSERLLLSRTS